uniref:Cell cycle control protein n=1 Tax=Neogobius melanostomus TaxID=47308 RepID=A0A8C6UGQ7_9GOBI
MQKKENQEVENRPDNTAFTQQRLPAWQPILSAGIVIPLFVLVGLAFIGIGVALFVTSRNLHVLEVWKNNLLWLNMALYVFFSPQGPVFFYYGLTNYFQNQRAYGVSKDYNQLSGDLDYFTFFFSIVPDSTCKPYRYDVNNKPIVPCGSLANSMFNDTFNLYQMKNGVKEEVPLDGKGISWWTDYNIKYRNPSVNPLRNAFNGTVKPLYWSKPAYELDPTDTANNGFINQDFLVWMRRSALPNFRKLYRRITDGLPAGNYSLEISYNYPVIAFDGKKKVAFSNVSWMGGKNEFLGIAYLVIGSLCLVMSVVMLIIYAKFKFPEED